MEKKEFVAKIKYFAEKECLPTWEISDVPEKNAFFDISGNLLTINGCKTFLTIEEISNIELQESYSILESPYLTFFFKTGFIRVCEDSGIDMVDILLNGEKRLFIGATARSIVDAMAYAKDEGQNLSADKLIIRDKKILFYAGDYHGETVKVPDNVIEIGPSAFSQTSVKIIELPEGVKYIGESAFLSCSELLSINFPKSLEEIGYKAFKNCPNLIAISIPSEDGESYEICNPQRQQGMVLLCKYVKNSDYKRKEDLGANDLFYK